MDAITMFKEAAAQLQKEEAYLYYAHARKENDEDVELQDSIGEFNLVRMELQQATSEQPQDEAKVEALSEKLNGMYDVIMQRPTMANYNEAKAGMDSLLAYINAIIQAACNGDDPLQVEEPSTCTGDCSGCAGCH